MISALMLNVFLAYAPPADYLAAKTPTTLNGSVEAIDKMPVAIYGQWAIRSTLLQAKYPDDYKSTTSDVWIFSKWDNYLTLTNPVTEATATISVDEVVNNRAKFSRTSTNSRKHERETVQIAIESERFSGTDTFVIEKYKEGKLISQDVVKYKIQGTKISGSNNLFD